MKFRLLIAPLLTSLVTATLSSATFSSTAFAQTEIDSTRSPAAKKIEASDDQTARPVTRDESRHGDPFMNVRVTPLGLLVGYINFDVDFKVSNEWAIGPSVTYWRYNADSIYFTGNRLTSETRIIGLRGTWAKNGTYRSGLYISPLFQLLSARVTGTSTATGRDITASATIPILTGLIGYQWFWGNLNLNVGGGFSVSTSSTKVDVNDGTSTSTVESSRSSGFALDAMLGYAF